MTKDVKPRVLRFSLMIIEATSIPLLVSLMVYLLSGYEIMVPKYGLFSVARAVHTDRVLRLAFTVMAFSHCFAGLVLTLERRVRNHYARSIAEILVVVVMLILVGFVISYELTLK